jgi:uncharacterized protein (TIGR02996 family)
MLQDETFIQAILDHPQEEANWLVYADWLEERGDGRATLYHQRRRTNSIGMEFVLVPRGTFWMGGGGGKPGHTQVTIPQEFYLGVYPVTQGQWQAIMDSNPCHFSRTGGSKDTVANISDGDLMRFPVENVSWDDAQQFIRTLNEAERRENDERLYRLPTEQEWGYACRDGARSREEGSFNFYFARPTNDLSSTQANFDGSFPAGDAAKGPSLRRPTTVGSYLPNRLGLYLLDGNVWEWTDSAKDRARVIRGGSWFTLHGSLCRAAERRNFVQSYQSWDLGFRLALVRSIAEGG